MKIEIDEKHIKEAERIFIGGNTFDKKERIPFIKNLKTCDLLAVPGSGKTTALMAKLYCLSKQLPFDDGSGILVLAHTNAAIDEIEKKLKKHCPNLFEYPNYVGTIQSFVNKFLAIPNYVSQLKRKPDSFDNDRYENRVKSFYENTQNITLKNWLINLQNPEKFLCDIRFDIDYNLKSGLNNKYEDFKLKDPEKQVYKSLKTFKENLIKEGVLHFDDGYFLAEKYILKYPQIKSILQKRFKYIFIDEMQDLEEFQIEIIDEVFFESDSSTIIQRIGDKNQSIYNNVKEICDWITREEKEPNKYKDLSLQNSLRLNKTIGELVDCFVLQRPEGYSVKGLFNFKNEIGISNEKLNAENEIPPHLVLFTNETKHKLKDKFEHIIKDFKLDSLEIINDKKAEKDYFKIIAWNTVWKENEENEKNRIRLIDIFPEYSKEVKSKKEYFSTLSKYLQLFDQEKKTLEAARKSILNALTTILYHQKIRFSVSQLIDFIKTYKKDDGVEVYEDFKLKLYLWAFELALLKKYEVVFNSVKEFIETDLKNWFNLELNTESKEFISHFKEEIVPEKEEIDETKVNIDISTVHSVKGKTLCATMYIESAFGKNPYETGKLNKKGISPLYLDKHRCNGVNDKQALKMMYVGFSRPTHLLCFAVLKGNINDDELKIMKEKGWKIDSDLATIDVKFDTILKSV